MGECIISRAGGGSAEKDPIPVNPTAHTVRVTLKDWNENPVQNYKIACNDGSALYEYSTNEKGQCLFTCNSGAANIHIRNVIDGVTIADIGDSWMNVDAPIGLTSDVALNLIKGPNYVEYTSNKTFNTLIVSKGDLYIIGGGGGGGAGGDQDERSAGGGGGSGGGWNLYNNITLNRTSLKFVVGSGGRGGYWWTGSSHSSANSDGTSGGTSYISGTSYSAIGGSGGQSPPAIYGGGTGGSNAGTGKGGNGSYTYNDPSEIVKAMNSPLNFAGGGGRGGFTSSSGSTSGGSPYGGSAGWSSNYRGADNASSGSRGGGGGGGLGDSSSGSGGTGRGGSGGSGLMRLYLHY